MAYTMYLEEMVVPIPPSKVTVKINNQNKTMTLIDGEEINILKEAGLTDISFELLLPQVSYPFARNVQKAEYYLNRFERLKTSKQPFQWIFNRQLPNGKKLFHSNLTVSLEDYQIIDDAGSGFDINVKVSLKQYKSYGTKTVTVKLATEGTKPTIAMQPPSRNASSAPKSTTYTVKPGDCLWNIAKQYLGNGARYTEIYNLNRDKIKNPNLIYPGQILTLPS